MKLPTYLPTQPPDPLTSSYENEKKRSLFVGCAIAHVLGSLAYDSMKVMEVFGFCNPYGLSLDIYGGRRDNKLLSNIYRKCMMTRESAEKLLKYRKDEISFSEKYKVIDAAVRNLHKPLDHVSAFGYGYYITPASRQGLLEKALESTMGWVAGSNAARSNEIIRDKMWEELKSLYSKQR